MNIPVYNIILGEADGIQIMSLVDMPAVESNFIAFSKEEKMTFSVDEEQHIVFGCALRADYPIYRFNERMGEYYVVFTKDTIKQLYQKFMIESKVGEVNLNHQTMTEGVHLIQSFIKDTEKGISPVGFEDVSDGSWFCAYHIDNEDVWNAVKQGQFNGFSIEGYFELEQKFAQQEKQTDEIDDFINEILN